ncbi:hypothetical protein RF11_11644 [Thelohanellus kitauei]|uniref:Uncharacterized protein n=1 Tax=Thelohanellus kitauei TaxID=669202 RepID=A0A0C2MFM6_THEKT|nr:hypothetical protein RF11_11644 [Thelohanellus kitauei]
MGSISMVSIREHGIKKLIKTNECRDGSKEILIDAHLINDLNILDRNLINLPCILYSNLLNAGHRFLERKETITATSFRSFLIQWCNTENLNYAIDSDFQPVNRYLSKFNMIVRLRPLSNDRTNLFRSASFLIW